MKVIPLGENIIVIRKEDKPSELIEVPEQYKKYSLFAEVIAVGSRVSPIIKPGAIIILRKTAGHEIKTCSDGKTNIFIVVNHNLVDAIVLQDQQ